MVRHSRNCTAGAVFTYHERRKVQGVGTQRVRLGADDMRRFEDCWLCLRPATENRPVATKHGYVYCKKCLVLNLEEQRRKHRAAVAQWGRLSARQQLDERLDLVRRNLQNAAAFDAANSRAGCLESSRPAAGDRVEQPAKRPRTVEDAKQSAFWISENTPHAVADAQALLAAPPPALQFRCPASGQPLRLKELIELHPAVEDGKWVCVLTGKAIGCGEAFAARSGGQIISKLAVEAGLLEGGRLGGGDFEIADLTPLLPAGTAYASRNKVEASTSLPAFGG